MRMNECRALGPLSVLVLSLALPAAAIESVYVIPAAAHTRGAAGSEWMTDLVLHNPGANAVTIDIALVRSGPAAATATGFEPLDTAVVAPGETLLLDDLLGALPGGDASGALIVSGTAPFTATSRTYVDREGGTRGAAIPVSSVFVDEGAPLASIPGIRVDGAYRSNIGVFALADGATPLEVEVSVSGSVVQRVSVPPGKFAHAQFPVASTGGAGVVSATVRIVSGEGLATAYASVVDNGSDDPTVIEPFALDTDSAARRGGSTTAERLHRAVGRLDRGGER